MTPVDRETPRTDANLIYVGGYSYVSPDFARQLERELASLRAELEAEKKLGVATSRDCNQVALERNGLRAEVARLREALEEIKHSYGKVCEGFELCTHPACASSYGAWAVADAALTNTGSGA